LTIIEPGAIFKASQPSVFSYQNPMGLHIILPGFKVPLESMDDSSDYPA
jgi:hypothetical protein